VNGLSANRPEAKLRLMRWMLVTLLATAALAAVSVAQAEAAVRAGDAAVVPPTRSCGFQSYGKGWYLRASQTMVCHDARVIFRAYFVARGCNGPQAASCTVRAFRCRYDYRDDVEYVSCSTTGKLVVFRSVP